jgi:hypothetical protein
VNPPKRRSQASRRPGRHRDQLRRLLDVVDCDARLGLHGIRHGAHGGGGLLPALFGRLALQLCEMPNLGSVLRGVVLPLGIVPVYLPQASPRHGQDRSRDQDQECRDDETGNPEVGHVPRVASVQESHIGVTGPHRPRAERIGGFDRHRE